MKLFHICESCILFSPLSERVGRYVCFKIANEVEQLWFVEWFNHQGLPVSLRVFDDIKEFERFYKLIRKSFKDERKKEHTCYVAGFKQGEEIPF